MSDADNRFDSRAMDRFTELIGRCEGLGADPEANIRTLVALFGGFLGAACTLYYRMERGVLTAAGQWNAPPGLDAVVPADGHICHAAAAAGGPETLIIRDLDGTPYASTDPAVTHYGFKACIARTVRIGGRCVGVLSALFRQAITPDAADLALASLCAVCVAGEERGRALTSDACREKERLGLSLDTVPVMVLALDLAGRLTYINARGCEIIGDERGTVLGKEWIRSYVPFESQDEIWGVFHGIVSGAFTRNTYENDIVTRQGVRRIVWRIAVLRDDDGAVAGVLAAGEDVTEQRRLEREAQRRLEDLERFSKFAIGREVKMMELKKRLRELEGKGGDE